MHNKIHSVISPLFRIKNADAETGWNAPIPMPVWIVTAETEYLQSEQKKFQNKSKNIKNNNKSNLFCSFYSRIKTNINWYKYDYR